METHSAEAALALTVALEAGKLIKKLRGESFEVSHKGPRDLVTSADLAADALICQRIRAQFPEHAILSEESAPNLDLQRVQGPLWVIDPIDGTTNYALGHYQSAVSIAFYFAGKGVAGAVYAPFLDEMFFAERGHGAFLNQTRLRRAAETLGDALVATGFPYRREPEVVARLACRARSILLHCRDLRRLGAASLDVCWVACGRLGAYYESVNPWDIAAARIIATEAGAACGNIYAENLEQAAEDDGLASGTGELYSRHFLASAQGIFSQLQELLQQADNDAL
jgi:myo-inositol-1(or 4)-monophosphatase